MKTDRPAFTLIELLIVVAIISLLIQLALPAVRNSREAARRTVCRNHLKQIGMAAQLHVTSNGRFPSGGWGFSWAGDPDRGNGKRQPGGWIYNSLPYLEQENLHALGTGQSGLDKKKSLAKVCQTPLALLICPSRRQVRLYPFDSFEYFPMRNTVTLKEAAKCDYAANAGDHFSHGYEGPETLAQGDSPDYPWDNPNRPYSEPSKSTGPIYQRSEITPSQVVDGMTHTYLVGEKYLNPDHYKDGWDGGDDHVMYGGFDADVNRFSVDDHGQIPPKQDKRGDDSRYLFGSAHAEGCHFVYCDGSVRVVSYAVDGEVHRAASNRKDEATPPASDERTDQQTDE